MIGIGFSLMVTERTMGGVVMECEPPQPEMAPKTARMRNAVKMRLARLRAERVLAGYVRGVTCWNGMAYRGVTLQSRGTLQTGLKDEKSRGENEKPRRRSGWRGF